MTLIVFIIILLYFLGNEYGARGELVQYNWYEKTTYIVVELDNDVWDAPVVMILQLEKMKLLKDNSL